MNLDNEKKVVDIIRRCQRNWDRSKQIPEEHLDHWIYLAQHSPSKQDEAYYNMYVITNSDLIDKLSAQTWGYHVSGVGFAEIFPAVVRNPQVAASAYLVFTSKKPKTMRNSNPDGTLRDINYPGRKINQVMAIGIAMGIIAFSAGNLGYVTGFNKNHGQSNDSNSVDIWKSALHIPESEDIEFGLGIGWPQEGKRHNEASETEFLVGEYPSTKYNINDNVVEWKGVTYKNHIKEIKYSRYSYQQKDIQVFKFY
jgi:nitroreductase